MSVKKMNILDGKYGVVGEKVIKWTLDPESRPATIADMEAQLAGAIELDPSLKAVMFIESPEEVVLFHLPPKEMAKAKLALVTDADTSDAQKRAAYALPSFYEIDANELAMNPEQLFYARVGDYTTQVCE